MTTTRRRFALLFVALVALVGVLAIGWAVLREIMKPEPVRAYERLRLGMTKDEVTVAIGKSPVRSRPASPLPGHYVREAGLSSASLTTTSGIKDGPPLEAWTWGDDDYWMWVAFGEDGKAIGLYLVESYRLQYLQPSLVDRVRQWVGL